MRSEQTGLLRQSSKQSKHGNIEQQQTAKMVVHEWNHALQLIVVIRRTDR